MENLPDGGKVVRFHHSAKTIYEKLDAFGRMPLPPYIKRQLDDDDKDDYQTVYAQHPGSAAAPTAGLHFTQGLMENVLAAGVGFARLTLHVGLGTFRPVMADNIEDHQMHSEWYSIDEKAAGDIRRAKAAGGRVIAVGTTCCRTLETVARQHGEIVAATGSTDIFLYPGSIFKAVDGLVTNFHLPESTLIMLVAAFCGLKNTMDAYREAIRQAYKFFSFGDAMLVL
jgi:S-adenosylmethionine:tRNA ribosyltransferase-isomerase